MALPAAGMAVAYLMIVACSYVGACLVCIVRGFQHDRRPGMTFLMFTSGVFWDVRALGDPAQNQLVLAVNPLAFIWTPIARY